jgi:hypothetical protein
MQIPTALTITDGAYSLDGGSVSLLGNEPDGTIHSILLPQHFFLEDFSPDEIPGQLYWDGEPVPVRSNAEYQLILVLENAVIAGESNQPGPPRSKNLIIWGDDIEEYMAAISESPVAAMEWLVRRVIDFVRSEEYTIVAHKIATLDRNAGRE